MATPITLSIVIPCLNEEETIKAAIEQAQKYARKYFPGRHEILVADNGSTDNSLKIIRRFKTINLVKVPVRGYGAALHWGVLKAKGKYILFADADLSYPFSNLKKFEPLLEQKPDLILGSRLKGSIQKGAMPWLHQYLGTPVLTFLIRLIYRIPTTDCNSGMRIVKKSFYRKLNMRNSGMEWASELLLKTALKKGKYVETPIRFLKDKRNRKPHLSTWADGWRHLKAIVLLKPTIFPVLLMSFLAAVFFSYSFSFALTTLFIMGFVVTLFSWWALLFLSYAIEQQHNPVSRLLNSSKLIIWTFMVFVSSLGILILLPEERLGSKMIIVSINAVLFIWVFMIETIKTHLINRLPDIVS